jgi:hypothetical protein
MRWLTEAADDRLILFNVTFVLDLMNVTTTIEGKNNWDDPLILTTADQYIKDEYGFSPYDAMYEFAIEAEAI